MTLFKLYDITCALSNYIRMRVAYVLQRAYFLWQWNRKDDILPDFTVIAIGFDNYKALVLLGGSD